MGKWLDKLKKDKEKELDQFFKSVDDLHPEDLDYVADLMRNSDKSDEHKEFAIKIIEDRKLLLNTDWDKELRGLNEN